MTQAKRFARCIIIDDDPDIALSARLLLRDLALPPGVLMSLIGGPFFVFLVWTKRRELGMW